MTVNAHEYHRTFNILGRRMPSGAELARDVDRELKEARAKYPRLPDHQALALLRDDKRRTQKPLPVHDAFEEIGSQYRTARIEEKRDQNFEKFATPWELFWSRLVMYWDSRLTPVVDNSGLVVAYIGDVKYDHFLIDQAGPTARPRMKNAEVLKHYRLFAGTKEFYGRTDLKVFGGSMITRHTVVTDIYGEVMSFELGGYKDESISSVSLLDIFGALQLARVALGLVVSLGRTGLRTMTRRPPTPVPTMGPEKTLPGMAVSTRGVLPVETVGRRTLILGDDMKVVKAWSATTKPLSGVYDVVVHGDATSFYILQRGVWQKVRVSDVASAIRPRLAPGDQIRLLACESGVPGGPAQQLANLLQRTVWATNKSVFPVHGKPIYDSKGDLIKFGSEKSFVPDGGGKFRAFDHQKAVGPPTTLSGKRVNVNVVKRPVGTK